MRLAPPDDCYDDDGMDGDGVGGAEDGGLRMVEAFPFGHLGEFEMLIDGRERSGMKTKDADDADVDSTCVRKVQRLKGSRLAFWASVILVLVFGTGFEFGLGLSMKYGWHTHSHTFRERSKKPFLEQSWMTNSSDSELMPCGWNWNRNGNASRSEQFVANNLVNKTMTNTFF